MHTLPPQRLARFRELWIHTGSSCNLSCPFCHEGSSPGDRRLPAPAAAQVLPYLREAARLGVERFGFTGGEPLIHREIVPLVREALALAPCLILTNGLAPLIRRPQHLALWHGQAHTLQLRVSIDHPDEALHDAGRGLKNFRKALEGLQRLHEAGFAVGVTRQSKPDEDREAITQRFRQLLRKLRLPDTLPIVALPDLGPPGAAAATVVNDAQARVDPPCAASCTRGRMLVLRPAGLQLLPCPLVDDTGTLDLGEDLARALGHTILPRHPRCTLCLGQGVPYAGEVP
ncbi:MAG: hypothetical protein RL026_2756 [Pseudomonadota bacterium]